MNFNTRQSIHLNFCEMSIISANTLFHFTRTKDTLLSILETGFRPAYSVEFGPATNGRIVECEIPMVCFCDLPLSSLDKHINGHKWEHNNKEEKFLGYGKHGLGMSKTWGTEQQLNPVTYATNRSHYLLKCLEANRRLLSLYQYNNEETEKIIAKYKIDKTTKDSPNFTDLERKILVDQSYIQSALEAYSIILNYVKPYEDVRDGRRYYDEREWRKVVPYDSTDFTSVPTIFPLQFPDQPAKKEEFKELIAKHHMLLFEPKDIKYIIVESDRDIEGVIDGIKAMGHKYSDVDKDRLTTRILTCEQLHDDF